MIQITEHIQANKDVLNFNGIPETQVVVFTWDSSKYKDMRCSADKMGSWFDYDIKYDIVDDGKTGRAIYYFTTKLLEEGTEPKKAYITFYFMSDVNNFNEDCRLDIIQTPTAMNDRFVTFSKDAIVVPFTQATDRITFNCYGGTSVTDAIFPNDRGVYGQISGNEIQIITLWNALSLPASKQTSHQRVTVKIANPDGSVVERYIDVIFILPHMCPVWQDLDTSYITTDNVVEYQIYDMQTKGDMYPENAIYVGKVYKLPDEDRIRFNLNKIIENYVTSHISMDYEAVLDSYDYGRPFRVKTGDKILGDYIFYNDWSFDETNDRMFYLPQNISSPITYDIVRGQTFTDIIWIPNQNPSHLSPWTVLKEGPDKQNFTPIKGYDNVYASAFKCYSIVYNTKNLKPDTKYLLCNTRNYNVIDCPCVKWVIHYLDKRGGYSSYPIYGNVNVSSKGTPHSMNKTFSNTSSQFEVKKYLFESTERYEVTFPMLKKNEAMRIDEILQSTEIWLERLSDNKMIPVLCDIDEFEYKNNKKVRNYTVPFITSQARLRK